MYSFVHEKSKEGDLYIVDNVENGIILSPEGPNSEGRPRENKRLLYDTVFGHGQSILQVFETPSALSMMKSVKSQFFPTLLVPISWTLAVYIYTNLRNTETTTLKRVGPLGDKV